MERGTPYLWAVSKAYDLPMLPCKKVYVGKRRSSSYNAAMSSTSLSTAMSEAKRL